MSSRKSVLYTRLAADEDNNYDNEQKKQKVSEVKAGIDEAEALIWKIDLVARSLQPNVKAVLLVKFQEYKSDFNNLKSEVKRITSTNLNSDAQEALLESGTTDAQTLHGVDDNIGRSKKILTNMPRRMSRNKWIIGSIIAVHVLAIIVILYLKLVK